MTHLIDKDVLVAEFKRRISLFKKEKKIEKWSAEASLYANVISLGARIAMLEEILSFLDTLEVKEVQESSAADRGMADEIIFALNTLGKEKMISYDKEIEWLRNKT